MLHLIGAILWQKVENGHFLKFRFFGKNSFVGWGGVGAAKKISKKNLSISATFQKKIVGEVQKLTEIT